MTESHALEIVGEPTPPAVLLERMLFEMKKVIVGQDRAIERMIVCLLANGPLPARERSRPRQDAVGRDAGPHRRRHVRPHPVHPRPAARRHRRHPHLPHVERALRRRARSDLRQLRARRRDQPGAGQGAVGAARGHGRAARHDRRRHPPGPRPVPRAGHAEPDRERGRVPAARGATRPLPHEDRARLPHARRRSSRSSTAWASRRRRRSEVLERSADVASAPARPPTTCYVRSQRHRVRREPRARHPHAAELRPGRPRRSIIEFGASPRASLGLVRAGRAMALLRGRNYVVPQDVFDVAPEILRHRLVLTYEALAADVDAEAIMIRVLSTVPAPRHPAQPHRRPDRRLLPDRHRLAGLGADRWPGSRAAEPAGPDPPIGDRRSADVLRRLELDVTRRLDGILHGDYRGLVPGHGIRARRGPRRTSPATTSAASTGTSPPARPSPTSASRSPTASSRPGSSPTARPASTSARSPGRSATWCSRAAAGVGFLTARGGNRIGAIVAGSDGVVDHAGPSGTQAPDGRAPPHPGGIAAPTPRPR